MRQLAGTLGAACAVLLLAGCGSSGPPRVASARGTAHAAASASASASTDPQQRARQFAACMRQHGVDMPDPDPGDKNITLPGGEHAKNQAAVQACQHFLGAKAGGRPNAAQLAKLRDFAKCMRSHGIADFPDPDPDTGGFTLSKRAGSDLNGNDPRFQQAETACGQTGPKGQ
jgi:hypothetical protein